VREDAGFALPRIHENPDLCGLPNTIGLDAELTLVPCQIAVAQAIQLGDQPIIRMEALGDHDVRALSVVGLCILGSAANLKLVSPNEHLFRRVWTWVLGKP